MFQVKVCIKLFVCDFQVAYMIVDDMHHNYPELLKDMHWNESKPIKLPYTEETQHYRFQK